MSLRALAFAAIMAWLTQAAGAENCPTPDVGRSPRVEASEDGKHLPPDVRRPRPSAARSRRES